MTGLFIYGVATITLWLIATVTFPDGYCPKTVLLLTARISAAMIQL